MTFWEAIISNSFISTCLSLTVPLLFAALAALVCNKSGLTNINIEGSMSVSALFGALVSHYTNSFLLGILTGMLTGIIMGMLLSFCAHKLKTDAVLAGVALNIFATGFVVIAMQAILGNKGNTEAAPSTTIPNLSVPGLNDVPILGAFFDQNILFYIAIISVFLVSFLIKRTRFGLRMRAVGYNRTSAISVGINAKRTQFISLIISGVFCGLGGIYMSMAYLNTFNSGMIAGRGFIGLAAEAMGGGAPYLTMLYAFIFGIVTAFSIMAQTTLSIPYELLNTMPYLMTIIALIIFSIKKTPKSVKRRKNDEKSLD